MSTGESSRCWIDIIFLGFTGERYTPWGQQLFLVYFLIRTWAE